MHRNICRKRSVNFPTHAVHYTNWTNTGLCVSLFPSAANPSLLFPSEAEASLLPSGLTLSRRYDHYHTDAFWWFNEFKCITYDHILTSSCQMFNRDEPEREKRVYVTVKASDMGRSVSSASTMSPLERACQFCHQDVLVIGNTICSEVNWSIINSCNCTYIIYICSIPFSHQASLGRCLHNWGQHQGQYWVLSCFYYDLASPLLHIKFKMINWSQPLFMLEIVLTGHQWQCPDLWPRKLRCSSCPGKPRLYFKR